MGSIDVRDILLRKASEYLSSSSDFDWHQEFIDREFDEGASEFMQGVAAGSIPFYSGSQDPEAIRKSIAEELQPHAGDDYEVLGLIRNWDLDEEYYEWCVSKGLFVKGVDPEDIEDVYGEEWLDEWVSNNIVELYEDPEIHNSAWEQWLQMWPGYEDVREDVVATLENMRAVSGSYDIDEIMSRISLALNVAHNTGSMAEYLGLNNKDLDALSNLDTSGWEEEMRYYASIRWLRGVTSCLA
jgi:hypothetical protein